VNATPHNEAVLPVPALPDDGQAAHLVAGTRLPGLALASTQGGTVDLAARAGRAIVYVYPWTGRPGVANPTDWDNIPGAHGSTPQAEGFSTHHEALRGAGYEVFGISGQSPAHQREFSARLGLPFALLSDAEFHLADALRLPRFTAGGAAYLKRLTLIVADGAIVEAIYPVADPAGHAAQLGARLARKKMHGVG
jgi:peroxiredoxin